MSNPLELFQQSFSLTIKKPSLILGLIYFGAAMLIGLGVGAIAVLGGFLGIASLAAINNTWISVIALILAGFIGLIILLIVQAIFNIFSYKGFAQIETTGNYNFDEISQTIRQRLMPTIVVTIITTILLTILFAIMIIPAYLLFQELGIIIGILISMAILFFASPLFINAVPIVVLERTGGIKAIQKSISFGIKNYIFNLAAIFVMMAATVVLAVLSIIPLVGMVISYLFTILSIFYLLKIYAENTKRSPGL
tara:strand:+ start:166 stop:921 length:756 start_codon:yes stop_codon:yes gene_type:complete